MKKNGIESYFQDYLGSLCHERMVILLLVAAFLVPAFFYLDFFILSEKSTDILLTLGFIRGAFVLIVIASYLVFKGNKFSLNHVTTSGYLFSFFTSAVIIYTTILLGGFDSTYYAGLNLVVVGIGVLIPWKP
ncbi:MAG: hypothetical protein IT569_00400, partial [Leptospiraceae bacterium]|nr:hypothetical protein [Leptospiraceae bacterium]